MANVLADRHHEDLYHSLRLLFRRLGHTLYTPVGMEWWEEGYWRFGQHAWGDDRLARQFLDTANWASERLGHRVSLDGVPFWHQVHPAHLGEPVVGLRLEGARRLPWAYVVATVQDNQAGFHRFAQEVGAKYVYQVGNARQQVDLSLDPIILSSSEYRPERGVQYHQEFDSAGTFRYRPIADPYRITSFVNCLQATPCYPEFLRYREALPEFDFRIHGIDGPDGNLNPVERIASEMAAAGWAWHDKETGDGFGHVVHDWAAIGRPLIGHARHYRGQMGEPFWSADTAIDLDARPFEENVALIREISAHPQRLAAMGQAIRAKFDALVDWEAEAERIRAVL